MKRTFGIGLFLCFAVSATAFGAAGSVSLIDDSFVEYFINTSVTFTSSSASAAASDASYTQSVLCTTTSGDTTSSTPSDAFDGYGGVRINGVAYTDNGAPTFECNNDRSVVFAFQDIGNLRVTRKVFVPEDDAFIRWLTIIENRGDSTETVNVIFLNNFGADGDTQMMATSDGDAFAEASDCWVVCGSFAGPETRIVSLFAGDGAAVSPTDLDFVNYFDILNYRFQFELSAGRTVILMTFASVQSTKFEAILKALEMKEVTETMLDCMSDDELAQVINFFVGDCNSNGVPDFDEADSDEDGIIDDCEGLLPGFPCAVMGGAPLLMMFGGYLFVLFARRRRIGW